MNVLSVTKYHWRRRRFLTLLFVVGMIAVVFVNAGVLMANAREVVSTVDAQGRIVERVTYPGLAFQYDPSRLINPSAFSLLIVILALITLRRDREFLVSCSVPRYRIWLGTCAFLILMSAALAIVGGVVAPAFCRVVLLVCGLPLRGGWDLGMILTGGDNNLMMSMLISLMGMIGSAGGFMLFGYLMLRWWKIILILLCALIASVVLMVKMIQWETFLAQVLTDLARWAEWAVERLIPWFEELFSQDNMLTWALYQMYFGLASMLLTYPIMRGMKVV